MHYSCHVCGKEWMTVGAPPEVTPTKRNEMPVEGGKCLACDNSGVVEHGGKTFKCPDCWRGRREAELWAEGENGGLPTMMPMSKA